MTDARSRKYWQERFEDLENARHRQASRFANEKLAKLFRQSESELNKEIERLYAKYAALEGGISRAELEKKLNAKEREELRWTLDEYKAHCEEYARKYSLGDVDKELLAKLERVSVTRRISKLDFLKLQIRAEFEKLYADSTDSLKEELLETHKESYYRAGYEVQTGIGEYSKFDRIDTARAKLMLASPWVKDGKTFSDRLWRDKEGLIRLLENELPKAFTRGASLVDIATLISKRMNVSYQSAHRLVMTESAFFATAGQKDAYDFLELEQYEFVATLDLKTSDICQSLDGEIFKLKDMRAGSNAPPMHCHCRSTTIPYVDVTKKTTRAARDPATGKTAEVEGALTYKDWKAIYVDKTMTMDKWRKDGKEYYRVSDVTDLYKDNAKPNKGSIKFDEGYRKNKRQDEVKTAEWLLANFGGDFVLVDELHRQDIKSPDYLWNGKNWDLKTITTEKAADSALRYGIKQVAGNIGGVCSGMLVTI